MDRRSPGESNVTPKQFYYAKPREDVEKVVRKAQTSFANFKQIAIAGGSVGKDLAARLADASGGEMTELEILYPERYESAEAPENSAA
jgi:Mg-chelatase subunit ChlD